MLWSKKTIVITSAITLAPMLVGIALWGRLPQTIATHFGTDGTPNGFSSKPMAVFGLPLFVLGIHLLCLVMTSLDPRGSRVGTKPLALIPWIAPSISVFVMALIYANALDMPVGTSFLSLAMTGIMFIAIGNYLPKCRRNYTVGIKIPWTLADEENWVRTHRMAGPLWVLAGVVLLVCATLGIYSLWVLFGILAVTTLAPVAYSLSLYLRTRTS